MSSPLVASQLVKVYRGAAEEVQAVRGVDLTVEPGQVMAVLGPSGSGKSTVLRLVAGLERPSAGPITHGAVTVSSLSAAHLRRWRRRTVAFVHERPRSDLIEHLDVADHVRIAALGARRVRPRQVLAEVGLAEQADLRVDRLSGGEQQRLALVCALVTGRPLVVVDEPTSHLDDAHATLLLDRLRAAARAAGTAVVFSTHDLRITGHADRLLHLDHGVLTSEVIAGSDDHHGVVDASGRVQLPPDIRALFPHRRVRITLRPDGVLLQPPVDDRADNPRGQAAEGS
jgi:putative ABC transport system ATP-binding protein